MEEALFAAAIQPQASCFPASIAIEKKADQKYEKDETDSAEDTPQEGPERVLNRVVVVVGWGGQALCRIAIGGGGRRTARGARGS